MHVKQTVGVEGTAYTFHLSLFTFHFLGADQEYGVIKNFMIQSGDTNSKHAKPGQLLGSGDFDYTTEAEFRLPQIFHRRGVVAMAREGDKVNPERRSSACQFYIVWGKVYQDDRLLAKVQEKLDSATRCIRPLEVRLISTDSIPCLAKWLRVWMS